MIQTPQKQICTGLISPPTASPTFPTTHLATSSRYPGLTILNQEPASQYRTAKESLSSCPACTSSQSTYLPSGHILRTSLYLLFIYSEIIPELTSILSAIVHFSQSASFVASASYRQLQAQPHFITVPSGNIYENTRCSHQRVVIFLEYSVRELLVNLRDARDQKYKCWNFMMFIPGDKHLSHRWGVG